MIYSTGSGVGCIPEHQNPGISAGGTGTVSRSWIAMAALATTAIQDPTSWWSRRGSSAPGCPKTATERSRRPDGHPFGIDHLVRFASADLWDPSRVAATVRAALTGGGD